MPRWILCIAVSCLLSASTTLADDAATLAARAWNLMNNGKPEKALRLLDRALELDDRNGDSLALKIRALTWLDRPQEALLLADEAVEVAPWYPIWFELRAEIKRDAGDLPGCLADLELAQEKNPQSPVIAHERGRVLAALHEPGLAAKAYTRALELGGNEAKNRLHRAYAYGNAGEVELAMADADRVVELRGDARSFAERALLKYFMGSASEALADLDRAIALDPQVGLYRARKATILALRPQTCREATRIAASIERPKKKELRRQIREGIHAYGNAVDWMSTAVLPITCPGKANLDLMREFAEIDLKTSPEDAPSHARMAMALYRLKRYEDAILSLERALEYETDIAPANVFFQFAMARARLGDPERARTAYEAGLQSLDHSALVDPIAILLRDEAFGLIGSVD